MTRIVSDLQLALTQLRPPRRKLSVRAPTARPASTALSSSATAASWPPPAWQFLPALPWRPIPPWPPDAPSDPPSPSPSQFPLPPASSYFSGPLIPPFFLTSTQSSPTHTR